MNPFFKVESSSLIDKRTKNRIISKAKRLSDTIRKVETTTRIKYPPYYVEPILTVVPSAQSSFEGLGVLYARTIPIQSEGKVAIIVELSAPLVLFGTLATLKTVLAHEFLHYVELVRQFVKMDITSQITATSVFEDKFRDTARAMDPSKVFTDKKTIRDLKQKASAGLVDPKLDEKCKTGWIDKGFPIQSLSLGRNQTTVSIEAIMRSEFDSKVVELLTGLKE